VQKIQSQRAVQPDVSHWYDECHGRFESRSTSGRTAQRATQR